MYSKVVTVVRVHVCNIIHWITLEENSGMMKIFLVDSDIECKSRTSSVCKNASSSEFSVAVVVLSELQSFSEYLTIVISPSTGALPFSCLLPSNGQRFITVLPCSIIWCRGLAAMPAVYLLVTITCEMLLRMSCWSRHHASSFLKMNIST